MQTHKEILRARVDDAASAYAPAAAESDRLHGLIREEKAVIDRLNADYAASCRAVANELNSDPTGILGEVNQHRHRLTGLEALCREADEKAVNLNAEHIAHSGALQVEIDREERETLTAAVVQAEQQLESAKKALKDAEQARHTAIWERSRFDRVAKYKLKETARA